MMHDKYGNTYSLPDEFNQNFLVCGDSGSGKSYFDCRVIEDAVKKGKRVVIPDFSESFTEDCLNDNAFSVNARLIVHDPLCKEWTWCSLYDDVNVFCMDVADALTEALEVSGRLQKAVLREKIFEFVKVREKISVSEFGKYLKDIYQTAKKNSKTDEEVETLKKIYERLQAMKCLNNFYIRNLENGNCEKRRGSVTIIQLSNLPKEEKKFMTIMIIELLWKEMKLADTKRHFDLLILDEFQHISRHASNTLKELFCQGRKKGLNVLLSTQFLTQYDSEDINSFCQNGGIVAFKPASKEDLLFSTKLIINYFAFDGDMKKWTNILKTLETGVGIYAGKYCINGKKKVYTEPFRCIVDEKIKDSK